ncbi:MAG TPA: hypothetical protein VM557_08365 [Thermoanaerobaculia bacterium]|nr:hypothetical protein [Thermoanaerobaculia bacterium]
MDSRLGTVLRLTAGVFLLVLGVIGALLPVLQGWVFFALALMMFFPNHRLAEKAMTRLEPRLPRLVGKLRLWGFGRTEDPLLTLDVGHWMHDHRLSLHLHRHQPHGQPGEGKEPGVREKERG